MRKAAATAAAWAAFVLVLWFTAAGAAWEWRNPLGNRTTFFTNFRAAMTFQALPQYQEKT